MERRDSRHTQGVKKQKERRDNEEGMSKHGIRNQTETRDSKEEKMVSE